MILRVFREIHRVFAIYVEGLPVAFKAEIACLGLRNHGARFTLGRRVQGSGWDTETGPPGTV